MFKKSVFLHPLFLFNGVWLAVTALYALHFSKLLIATDSQIATTICSILLPFDIAVLVLLFYFRVAPKEPIHKVVLLEGLSDAEDLKKIEKRLRRWLFIWGILTVVEIVYSKGFPLVWLITGNSKTYSEFGITSVHGLLNSLIVAIGLCYVALYARYRNRRYLVYFGVVLLWSVALINRSMLIVSLLQAGIVVVLFRGVTKRMVMGLVSAILIVAILFGVIGDIRSGAEVFMMLAQPTDNYPRWLPSGFLWVYTYMTTPLNNLIYTTSSTRGVDNILFPNTVAPLFPTVIRRVLYGDALSEALSGELVDSSFNVSTAYVGPYQDYGVTGIACFSILMGFLAYVYWRRRNLRDVLIYVVFGQCLLISIFYNYLFSLPVITQVLWLALIFYKSRSTRTPTGLAAPV